MKRNTSEHLPMTADEITALYRDAKDKQMEIRILADLNLCTKDRIVETLAEQGIRHKFPEKKPATKKRTRMPKIDDARASALYAKGLKDEEIAERMGYCTSTVYRWRHSKDLKSNWSREKEKKNARQERCSISAG